MLHLPERIHKRPFVVAVIVLVSIVTVSAVLIFALGLFGADSDLPAVQVYASEEGADVNGVGVNMSYMPTSNLITNPSFEDLQYDQTYTVSGASSNAVYVLSDSTSDTLYSDDCFNGGAIRIMSLDADGALVSKLQSTVTDFEMNQLGLWNALDTPEGTSGDQVITSAASSSSVTVTAGTKGLLISDAASSSPTVVQLNIADDFVGISCISDRFFAVTKSGTFVTSSDGKTWNSFSPSSPASSIHTVTSLGKTGVAAGDAGEILILSDGIVTGIPSVSAQSFLTSCSDGNTLILAGTGGTAVTSSNGISYRELGADELPVFESTPEWVSSDCLNGKYVLGGDKGQIAEGEYSAASDRFVFTAHQAKDVHGSPIQIRKMMLVPSGEMIILDTSGSLYCSDSDGDVWKTLSSASLTSIDSMGLTSNGKIIFSQGLASQTTQLYTCITFEDIQSEEVLQAGDMCFLQYLAPSETGNVSDAADMWQSFGNSTDIETQDNTPSGGGMSSIRLVGGATDAADEPHYISQVISAAGESPFQNGPFYQVKAWLKQDGIDNGEVMAWISGNFTSVGTTFTDVGGGWRQYTYTFALPSEASGKNTGEVRFNIGFIGTGELSIDKVYLGLQSNSDKNIPDDFLSAVSDISPSVIRLANVGIGQFGVPSGAWLLSSGNDGLTVDSSSVTVSGCDSLESSLRLVRDAEACPWLVIGSGADKTTVENLIEYLCGSLSDPYGKVRIENGTSFPWSMQFDRIFIEISDANGIFSTDLQRGAYVDYMIKVISSSPYYVDMKDKIYFLDGMNYDGGTMLSQADYHTSSLRISNLNETELQVVPFDSAVSAGYDSYFDSIPRSPSGTNKDYGEWICSASLDIFSMSPADGSESFPEGEVTAAHCAVMLLSDLGDHTYTVMADLPVSRKASYADTDLQFSTNGTTAAEKLLSAKNNETLLAAAAFLQDVPAGKSSKIVTSLPASTGGAADTQTANNLQEDGLKTYAFMDKSTIHLVAANISDKPKAFLLKAGWSLKGDSLRRYASDGSLIEETVLGQGGNRINLLPGQVIVAEITVR